MGLLDFLPNLLPDDPQKAEAAKMGLLNFGAQMLANSRQGFAPALGQGLASGTQAYQGARDNQFQGQYKQAQMAEMQGKADAAKHQQNAFSQIQKNLDLDPNYKPPMSLMMAANPEMAMKGLMPAGAVDVGLEPKVGRDSKGNLRYFVQDKSGNTKWLDAGVPDNFKYVPGDDYKAPAKFDPRSGAQTPVNAPQQFGYPSQPSAAAPQEQAPVDPNAPWANLRSPKEQDDMKKRVYEQDNKRLDAMRQQVTEGRATMTDLQRFNKINQKQGTGGAWNKFTPFTIDSELQELESITTRLAPKVREPGSGSTSDKEMDLYLKSLPGIDKYGNVNTNIITSYETQLKEAEKQLAFREQWLTKHGHLTGADEAYQASKSKDKKPNTPSNSKIPPAANPNGSWDQVSTSYASGQGARNAEQINVLQGELAKETNPANRAALERELSRLGGKPAAAQASTGGWSIKQVK